MSRSELPMVAPRSRRSIELWAETVVQAIKPGCLITPQAFPVAEFVEFDLPEQFGIDVDVRPLPAPTEAVMIPGSSVQEPARIILSPRIYRAIVAGNGRARFTGMHEGFHAIAHAREIRSSLADGLVEGLFRSSTIPTYRNPEWQANAFASAALMPERAVRALAAQRGPDAAEIARAFQVSQTAARVRLDLLGLL